MKKPIVFFLSLLLSFSVATLLTSCEGDGDDEPAVEYFSFSGNVTYPDFSGTASGADGAVVFLAKSDVATTNYDYSTVADANGDFSFENLEVGNYFVFVNFNTANTNNAGRVSGINFDTGEGMTFEIVDASVTQNLELTMIDQDVQFAVNNTESGDWRSDISHSNVNFSFPYDNANATYVGRFNSFAIDVVFDKDNLAGSSIEASIDLLSINTSSPGGRDSYEKEDGTWDYGCTGGTFAVLDTDGNTVSDGGNIPDESTRYATFKSSSIEAYGDGFLARGTMMVKGSSNEEVLFFRFINGFEAESRSGALTRYSSFDGQLEFDALGNYGIESGHLADARVTIDISFQVNKALE
ncbi:MAG: YceI family protein [Cyclobacteriaceae bacterium]